MYSLLKRIVINSITLLFFFCLSLPAWAETVSIEGIKTSRYARIIFSGQQPVIFDAVARGNVISVQFKEAVTISNNRLSSELPNEVKRLRVINDRAIVITLNSDRYRIRWFSGDNKTGIDLIETTEQAGLQSIVPTNIIPASKPDNPPAVNNKKEKEVASTKAIDQKQSPQDMIAAIPAGVGQIKGEAPIPKQAAPRIERMQERSKILKKSKSEFSVAYQKKDEQHIMTFPWRKRVASAVFVREGILWVVFDEVAEIDVHELKRFPDNDLIFLGETPSLKVTLLRFRADNYNNLQVRKSDKRWIISFGGEQKTEKKDQDKKKQDITNITPIYSIQDNKKVILDAGIYSTPVIKIIDPMVRDELKIIPIFEQKKILKQHDMVDVVLLQTAQGIAAVSKADNLRITAGYVPEELFILMQSGHSHMNAKKNIRAEENTQIVAIKPQSLVDFTDLTINDGEKFYAAVKELQRGISFLNGEAKNHYRFEFAKLYLANQMYQESLNVMHQIDKDLSAMSGSYMYQFTKAVAYYMNEQYEEAYRMLQAIDIEGADLSEQSRQEIEFWKKAAKFQLPHLTDVKAPDQDMLSYKKYQDLFMLTYPKTLQNHFALQSIKQYLGLNKNEEASILLDSLVAEDIPDPSMRNEYFYLKGVYLTKMGDIERGMDLWEDVTTDLSDRKNRAKAEFAEARLLYNLGEIDIEEAIERFNQVRFIWRGDEIEREAFRILGQIYIDNGQYPEGLRAWRSILSYFPSDKETLKIANRMSRYFTEIYTGEQINEMSEIDALGLYYEFRELTPIGELGDKIVQELAERLVRADLLNRAAALLTHQIKFRLKGKKKTEAGARLAEIHLMNKNAKLAIQALIKTDEENMPIDRWTTRQLLKAEANIVLEDYDEAIANLKGVPGSQASIYVGHAYWEKQDWPNVIASLEPLFTVKDNPLPVDQKISDAMIKLAVAYTYAQRRDDLLRLYRNFSYLLEEEDYNREILEFLVNNIAPIDHNNFTETVNLDNIRNFLRHYGQSKF